MATNNSTSDIEILVGVQGGESINEGSGKEISSTLKKIAQNISQQKLIKVTVGADQTTTKRAIQQVLNQSDLKLHNVGFGNNVANSLQSQLAKMGLTIDIGVNIKEAKKKIEKTQKKIAAEAAKAAKPDAQKTPEVKVSQGQVNRWIKSLETKKLGAGNGIMGIKEVADAWEKAQAAVNEYGSDVSKQGPVEAAAVDASIKRLDELISKYKKLEKANSPENRANSQASAKKALADFNAYLTTLKPKALIEFGDSIARIRSLLSDGTPEACKKAKIAINDLKGDMKRLGYEGGNVFTYLQEKVRTFATYLISSTFTMGVANTFSNVVSTVKDLDAALTDLQIVTGETTDDTKELLKTYNQMAQELGTTTANVAAGATDWLRQGYSETESSELLKQSMTLSIVGGMDAEAATTAITAALKGLELQAESASDVVDKFFKVDMMAATSAEKLAVALSKTAANAKVAGISMDDVIG